MNETLQKISKAVSEWMSDKTSFSIEDYKKIVSDNLSSYLAQHADEYEVTVQNHPDCDDAILVDIRIKPKNVVYSVDPIVYNES